MATLKASPFSKWWIIGPWQDLVLFALVPAWIIPCVWMIKDRVDMAAAGTLVLALGAMGHHLPGFIRAYTDPILFHRFRFRFTLAPLFFIGISLFFAWRGFRGLETLLVVWGMWHGAMQINGFLRIYDAKVQSFSPLTGWLDWGMCLTWFAWGVFHSPGRIASLLSQFYGAGGFLIPPHVFRGFELGWDTLTYVITVAFLFNAWWQTRRGVSPNPVKFLVMASSFSFWWFAMIKVNDILLGVILFEIFHDVQYNSLVWLYNRRRVAGNFTASKVERFLFQPQVWKIAIYGALILAYGYLGIVFDYASLTLASTSGSGDRTHYLLTHALMASAFLHFYYDGFIWRVREGNFRKGMGIEAGSVQKTTPSVGGKVHWIPALKWSLFLVPAAYLIGVQVQGRNPNDLEHYRNLVEIVPKSWLANFMLANLEKGNGEKEKAIDHFERALTLKPNLDVVHVTLAELFYMTGNFEQAISQYRQAVDLDAEDVESRNRLGMLLLKTGRLDQAIPVLAEVVTLDPGNVSANYNLAAAYLTARNAVAATPYLLETVRLDPNHKLAVNHLGVVMQVQGRIHEAVEYYRRAVALDTGYVEAKRNLARAEMLLKSMPPDP